MVRLLTGCTQSPAKGAVCWHPYALFISVMTCWSCNGHCLQVKKRDAPAKEPKVRPGFGAFVPRAARQQDAGSNGTGGAAEGESAGAAKPASASGRARANAAAAQAPTKERSAQTTLRGQAQQPTSPKQQAKQHPASPRQQKQQRGRQGDKGHKRGDKQRPQRASVGVIADFPIQASDLQPVDGSQAEASAAPPAGSGRRQRGRGTARASVWAATGGDGVPAPGAQPTDVAAEAAPHPAGGAAKKAGKHRGRPERPQSRTTDVVDRTCILAPQHG